jgi:hypothetical protein
LTAGASSHEPDVLQAQYFHCMLRFECDVVRSNLARHTARMTEAQRRDDQFLMRCERRMVRKLEIEQRKLMDMLGAIENRFPVAQD